MRLLLIQHQGTHGIFRVSIITVHPPPVSHPYYVRQSQQLLSLRQRQFVAKTPFNINTVEACNFNYVSNARIEAKHHPEQQERHYC
jgi:hypothetical protein